MKRFFRKLLVQACLALAASSGAAFAAQAALPGMPLSERATGSAAPATPSLHEQLDAARVQLEQALSRRDQQARQHPDSARQDLALDRQRLLDWLVDLHREKLKHIEELIALRKLSAAAVEDDPLLNALSGEPPYSALHVDALRDEIDGLTEKRAAAEARLRAMQTEMQGLHEQLKARAAATRQANERVLAAGSPAAAAKARDEGEVSALLKQVAEVEIAVTALEQEVLGLQLAAWRERIGKLQAVLAKALPAQRLSLDDMAAQRQRLSAEHAKLASEMALVARQHALRRTNGKTGQAQAVRDILIRKEKVTLKGLERLQMLNKLSGDAWEKRHAILSGSDPQERQTAMLALAELGQKLADLRNQSGTQQEALRTEIRAQRIRVENLAAEPREQEREKEVLNLLLRQTAMDERLALAAGRLEKQVSRWLADFAQPADQGLRGRLLWIRDQSIALLRGIWQQELFVAEDVSEIEGRQVSVKYGITVGKSIGLVVVFIAGYWLLAMLSRFIQNQLVRRLKVSQQLASVVRRWSMIGLSLALIILLLNLARIPLSVFAFLGGTLVIGVGFGAQTIIKNFISGLIVLFERKVRVGDVVELGGVTGYVTAVDLRATTVRSANGVEALIPNANFIENQVINWTYSNRQVRRELLVDIAYGADVRLAESLFLAAAAAHPCVLKDPAPEVLFDGFGDSALKMSLIYWVEFDGARGPRRVDSDLRHEIHGRLNASGIAIPFPQREVHVNLGQSALFAPTSQEPIHAR